jgi:chromate transporter
MLFWVFFKVSIMTIGGGQAMIPFLIDELVSSNLMTLEAIYDFLSISELLPGPFATDIATFVGSNVGGVFGSIIAVLGMVLPSILGTIVITLLLKRILKKEVVEQLFAFLRPVVISLILMVGVIMIKDLFLVESSSYQDLIKVYPIILILYFGHRLIKKKEMSPLFLVLFSGVISLIVLI